MCLHKCFLKHYRKAKDKIKCMEGNESRLCKALGGSLNEIIDGWMDGWMDKF